MSSLVCSARWNRFLRCDGVGRGALSQVCLIATVTLWGAACSNGSSSPEGEQALGGAGGQSPTGVVPTGNGGTANTGTPPNGGTGNNSGIPEGGSANGGTMSVPPNGSANGGSSNGGMMSVPPNGGAPNGGAPNGGSANGGSVSVPSNGGSPNGGSANGGSANGGSPNGDTVCDPSSPPAIQRLGLETVVQSNDFQVLVYAAQPPGSEDWYLVDALGYVRVYSNGVLQPTPFLDVSSEVQDSGFGAGTPEGGSQNYDERGLLSIAFPPDYETSGKFYVTLIPTTTTSDLEDHDLLLEYARSTDNPLVADPSSRKAIIDLERGGEGYTRGTAFSYAKYHNASTALFGPDGMLYLGMGDGGGDCNAARPGAPQDVNSPYGKILRLDPNAAPPYGAADNPFVEGGDSRVLHYGLRNPFRFNFDSLTGDLYIGEVGQWTNDWLTYAPAGAQGLNFGWPTHEGTENPEEHCPNNTPLRSGSTRSDPIFNLSHGSTGGAQNLIVAIVGGTVYRGSAIPDLRGAYLFGEFYPNRPMRALYQCGTETSGVTVIDKSCDPNTPDAACFMPPTGDGAPDALRQTAAIIEGHDGELYIPANGNALLKVVPAP